MIDIDQNNKLKMLIRKAYRFRLKTDDAISAKLAEYAGCCRFVWNKCLEINKSRLKNKHPIMRYGEMDFWSKLWKKSDEYSFLGQCPAHLIQQKLKDLDKAYRDGFDKSQINKRLPKPRKKYLHDSIRFPEPKQFVIDNRRIKLPKLGWISFFKSQKIHGSPKNATISRQGKHWYLSIQVALEMDLPKPKNQAVFGIDLGVAKFAMCSDGYEIKPVNSYKNRAPKLAKLQRQLSKKEKYSNNWKKQKTKIQKLHSKITNIRRDTLHKASTQISKNHAIVALEDLKVSNMSRSAKGSIENPGRQVKAKSGLNKSILDQGWYEFRRQLDYKLSWRNGYLVLVNPQYTSQKCSKCGHSQKENRQTQSFFECIRCGMKTNADLNAAKNIKAAGQAVLACGEEALATSMKQEPLGRRESIPA